MLTVAGLALAGCTSTPAAAPTPAAPSSSSAAPTPTPTPSPTGPGIPAGASPLSGTPGGADKPVLIVKIDNTGNAQPQAGIKYADIVYVEEVEWGITRLAAVFSSTLPKEIGPIRSARITDIELTAQYGEPAFAYSGAQKKLLPLLARAPFIDVSYGKDYQYYWRAPDRPSVYGLMLNGEKLMKHTPKASLAKDIGFVFGDAPVSGGVPVSSVRADWPEGVLEYRWNEKQQAFAVNFLHGPAQAAEGGRQFAKTAIMQFVHEFPSRFHDHSGGVTPNSRTVGTGSALVLRDGQMWEATWSRPSADVGTTFTLADGSPMPFNVGQVWIGLINKKEKVKVTDMAGEHSKYPPSTMGSSTDS